MTVRQLALKANIAKQTITNARGAAIRECRLSTLERIAEALNVPLTELFSYTPDAKSEAEK